MMNVKLEHVKKQKYLVIDKKLINLYKITIIKEDNSKKL